MEEPKKILVPRVTQLDANEFDKEVYKILYNQLTEITNIFKPGTFNNVKAELTLLLNLIIWKYSVVKNNATFGQNILGLKYDNSLTKTKAVMFALLNYVFPYLITKFEDNAGRFNNMMIREIMNKIEVIVKASHFLNFLVYLKDGKYPTVTDRLLGLQYVATPKFSRSVGYNFMIRQLLWHGFMELLTHALPLINYSALRRKVKAFFQPNSEKKGIVKYVIHDTRTKCVVCDDYLVLPCTISIYCPHLACYYCLKSNLLADKKFMCPECNEPNTVSEEINFL